jgi:hypothetical protein
MKTRLGILAVPLTTVLLLVGPSFARDQTSRAGSSGREKRVQKLLATIRDASLRETDPDRVFEAIDELGDMRAVEAVDDLVGLLTLRRSFPWEKDPTQPIDQEAADIGAGGRYPAVRALRNIGPASVPALVRVIEAHDPKSLEVRNAMAVILTVSANARPKYVAYLRRAAALATSAEASERLKGAAEELEHSKR